MDFFEASYKQPKREKLSETSVDEDLAFWQTTLDALEIDMMSTDGMSRLPDWWYDNRPHLILIRN
jgi:hypothetical protein